MKLSSLFHTMGTYVEMEVYNTEKRTYICTLTKSSRVPIDVYKAEVETVIPLDTEKMAVFVRKC